MIRIFHGKDEESHKNFQAWRRANVDGFHMTESAAGQFTIHYTQDKRENSVGRGCTHQGGSNNKYLEDQNSCYTTTRKVCSPSLAELIAWAINSSLTTKNCKHCDTKRFPFPETNLRKIKINSPDRLTGQEGDRNGSGNNISYSPLEGDRRLLVERQIRERRGQQHFRDALRKRYGNRCLVTGCEILAVLEAAHIRPYRGANDNHPENGLLLRSDIHTLFDLDLLGIEPEQLRVVLHPEVVKEYGRFADVRLCCVSDRRPSLEALRLRYEQFHQRLHRPA